MVDNTNKNEDSNEDSNTILNKHEPEVNPTIDNNDFLNIVEKTAVCIIDFLSSFFYINYLLFGKHRNSRMI